MAAAAEICGEHGMSASAHVRLGGDSPAEALRDDLWTANRACEALLAAGSLDNVTAYLDTLADVDRGYFVRNGVLDRLCNPRPAFHALWRLQEVLRNGTAPGDLRKLDLTSASCLRFGDKQAPHALLLPNTPGAAVRLPLSEVSPTPVALASVTELDREGCGATEQAGAAEAGILELDGLKGPTLLDFQQIS